MKVNPSCKTATTACIKAIMFAGMIILLGQSQSVLAQYGPRCWSPPPMGNFYSLQLVASDSQNVVDNKGIWLVEWVDGHSHPTFITNISTKHLEGAVTLPNTNNWGPWAGKIITGDEAALDEVGNPRPLIYAIDTNGTVASFSRDIAPEDFDIIPADQDLYCTVSGGDIVKLSSNLFTNYVGYLLITQSGELLGQTAKLFIVNWDASINDFVIRTIQTPYGGFEHVTFAPIHLPVIP